MNKFPCPYNLERFKCHCCPSSLVCRRCFTSLGKPVCGGKSVESDAGEEGCGQWARGAPFSHMTETANSVRRVLGDGLFGVAHSPRCKPPDVTATSSVVSRSRCSQYQSVVAHVGPQFQHGDGVVQALVRMCVLFSAPPRCVRFGGGTSVADSVAGGRTAVAAGRLHCVRSCAELSHHNARLVSLENLRLPNRVDNHARGCLPCTAETA